MVNLNEKLRKIITKVLLLEESEVHDDISQNDIESWDSLAHLFLINEVESAFKIVFSDEEVIDITTIGALKKALENRGIRV